MPMFAAGTGLSECWGGGVRIIGSLTDFELCGLRAGRVGEGVCKAVCVFNAVGKELVSGLIMHTDVGFGGK